MKRPGIDDLRRAVRALGLESRGGIRDGFGAVHGQPITVSGGDALDEPGEVAAGLGSEGSGPWTRGARSALRQDNVNAVMPGRPDPKRNAVPEELRPDGQSARHSLGRSHAPAPSASSTITPSSPATVTAAPDSSPSRPSLVDRITRPPADPGTASDAGSPDRLSMTVNRRLAHRRM